MKAISESWPFVERVPRRFVSITTLRNKLQRLTYFFFVSRKTLRRAFRRRGLFLFVYRMHNRFRRVSEGIGFDDWWWWGVRWNLPSKFRSAVHISLAVLRLHGAMCQLRWSPALYEAGWAADYGSVKEDFGCRSPLILDWRFGVGCAAGALYWPRSTNFRGQNPPRWRQMMIMTTDVTNLLKLPPSPRDDIDLKRRKA